MWMSRQSAHHSTLSVTKHYEFNKSFVFLQQFYCPMGTTVGQMDPPLGNTRLQVAKLIAILLANSLPVHSDIGNLATIDVLLVSFSFNCYSVLTPYMVLF